MNTICEHPTQIYKSVRNRKWKKYSVDYNYLSLLKNSTNFSSLMLELMMNRNIPLEEINHFISPKLKNYLPDPNHLLDMEKAAKFLAKSMAENKNIAVFGDYDVDGATSAALIKKFFGKIKKEIGIYIPDRIREGYGPNIEALKHLKAKGVEVVVTVDCGAVAYDALAEAKEIGLEVVVIDHHQGGERLPDAIAVVNPNRQDETSDYTYLCAAGVTFLLLISLNNELKKSGLPSITSVEMLEMLDLVALGTVCDVVPIKGLNRAFVSQGIKLISRGSNTGINALKQITNLNSDIDAYHLGFVLGPRINAAGRVGDANLGAELLSCEDYDKSIGIARSLDMHNHERRAIEMKLLEEAINQVAQNQKSNPVAFIIGEKWHLGVIGIIAGRLKENFNKPSIVITVTDGIGKASCRSVKNIDIGRIIHKAKEKNLLLAGGGHAMAAGFTVAADKIMQLQEFIEAEISQDYNKFLQEDYYYFDSILNLSAIDIDLIADIAKIGPFGSDNPHPVFRLNNINVNNSRIVGGDHVSCFVTDGERNNQNFIKAISFRAINSPVGEILLRNQKNIDLIGRLSLNKWNGKTSVEITIDDIIIEQPRAD